MGTRRVLGYRPGSWLRTAAMVALAVVALTAAALLAAACEEGEEEVTATPTATETATAIASPTASPTTSPSPPAATPTATSESPTPAATPAPSPTPEVAACPDDDPAFCAFAAQVEQAIADEDADFFVANSLTESILCTAEAADVGYLCGPEQIGETIIGIPYGREASEGTLMPPDDYREMWVRIFGSDLPAEEDAEGNGELRIWGLAYRVPPAEGTPRNIVVTYISDAAGLGPEREAFTLSCELADGQWQIRSFLENVLALGSPRDTAAEWRDWPE